MESNYQIETLPGTATLFLFVQPLRGWRQVNVTARRTGSDFAHPMQELGDVHFPQAEVIRVVVDNLNPHTPAAFYETFAPAEARRLTRKLDFHYTPKHGSWLNMAECEFAVLTKQCLAHRVPNVATLRREIAAWPALRNRAKTLITWRFATADARVKLHRLYPATAEQEQSPVIELEHVA
jgi:transposase